MSEHILWSSTRYLVNNFEITTDPELQIKPLTVYTPVDIFFATCHVLYNKFHDIYVMRLRDCADGRTTVLSFYPRNGTYVCPDSIEFVDNKLIPTIMTEQFIVRMNALMVKYYEMV